MYKERILENKEFIEDIETGNFAKQGIVIVESKTIEYNVYKNSALENFINIEGNEDIYKFIEETKEKALKEINEEKQQQDCWMKCLVLIFMLQKNLTLKSL